MARTSTRPRATSPLNLPGAFELFRPSRDLIFKHFDVFGPLFVIPLIFWLHSWVDTPARGHHWSARITDANYSWSTSPPGYFEAFVGFSILWFLIAVIVGTAVQVMLQRAQLDAVEHKKPDLGELWQVAKTMGPRMLGLYVVISVVMFIGFLLLIVPGFFMWRRYLLAPYVMLDKKCGIKEAMDRSAQLSLINPGAIWGIIGVIVLLGVIGIVPFVGSLASFVLGCLYSAAPAIRYQQLKKLS